MNSELQTLYTQDQADRIGQLSASEIYERDRVRRKRAEEIIAAAGLQAPEDYYHTAMIFQHGESQEHYWQAHELAKKAANLGFADAKWLAAAAYDRWLMRQGKPQKYGTQYILDGSCWKLWPIDPTTTDAERAEWNVPPLEEALQRAADMSCNQPPAQEQK